MSAATMRTTLSSFCWAVPSPAITSRKRRRTRRDPAAAAPGSIRLPPESAPRRRALPRVRGSRRCESAVRRSPAPPARRECPWSIARALPCRRLPGPPRAAPDVAVDRRATQGADPEVLDFELRILLRQGALGKPLDDVALLFHEGARAFVGQRAYRNHRKARIELNRRHGVTRRRANEGLLEFLMGDRLMRA